VIVRKGDVLGSFGFGTAVSPWNITTSIEYQAALTPGVAVDLLAEDTFHSRSPGPFAWDNPASPFYGPGLPPDASTNVLNLRARLRWPSFDVTLFANNALDAQPTLGYNGFTARTFRPRAVGLSATWRLERIPHGD
jgi:iron complex outermembrane recepter protein